MNGIACFDSFGAEHIPKEISSKYHIISTKISSQIFIEYNQMIQKCVHTFVLDLLILKGRSLVDYINLFSPNEYEKNGKMILKCFD